VKSTRRPAQDHRPREGTVQDQQGKYVAPVPIENRLAEHPAVEAVCVAGSGRPQPFALAMLAAGADRGAIEVELTALLDRVKRATRTARGAGFPGRGERRVDHRQRFSQRRP